MKSNHIISILAFLLIFLSSCREISVTTMINEDGSFTRVITITDDSKDIDDSNLPYPIDASWEKKTMQDSSQSNNYIITYTKTYENSNVLNKELMQDTGWRKQIEREVKVKKSFWFFNSYLTYRETWKSANPFNNLDYRDYLSEEDLLWLTGYQLALNKEDSARIEEAENKAEQFLKEAISGEIIDELKRGIKDLGSAKLKPETVSLHKDSIVSKIESWDFDLAPDFIDFYAEWTDNEIVLQLHSIEPPLFENLDKNFIFLEKIFMMETFHSYVEMPGLIAETNSPSIKGNQVSWKVSGVSFLFEDYEMTVKSRIMNTWAYVVAGIVLLLLIVVLIAKARK